MLGGSSHGLERSRVFDHLLAPPRPNVPFGTGGGSKVQTSTLVLLSLYVANNMEIFRLIFPVFSIIALGYAMRRTNIIENGAIHALNMFVYNVALPAVIFLNFWRIDWHDPEILAVLGFNVGVLTLFALLLLCILHFTSLSPKYKAAVFMSALVGNTVYMGFPLGASVFGQEHFQHFVAAAAPHVVIGMAMALLAAEYFVVRARRVSVYVRDFFINPLIIALILGVVASLIRFHGAFASIIEGPIGMLAATASPVALFALGAFLYGKFSVVHGKVYPVTVALKLIALPVAIFFGAISMGGVSEFVRNASLLAAAMPTAVTVFVISEKYDILPDFVAHVILVGTAFSVVTISAILAFI